MKKKKQNYDLTLNYILIGGLVVIYLLFAFWAGKVKAEVMVDPSVVSSNTIPEKLLISPILKPTNTPIPTSTPTPTRVPEKTTKQKILTYIVEKFGDKAPDAISIINLCENGTFDPHRLSGINTHKDGRRTIDVGVFQMNVNVEDTAEIERLKDWKYNIDRAYEKFKMGDGKKYKNTFYLWTCGHVVGDYTYVDRLKGK